MSLRAAIQIPARTVPPVPFLNRRGVLQRACACGGSAGPTGECAECRRKRTLQPKLTVNHPGDRYEQEADRVAEQVMRMPASWTETAPLSIQRLPDEGDLRRQAEEEEEELLQTKAEPARTSHAGAEAPPVVRDVLRSPGRPLDGETQGFMEQHFGHDFSQVRVHAGGQASASAHSVGARAYTVGRDVVFGTGEYAPGTGVGRKLLAHELTHVVQQTQSAAGFRVQRTPEDPPGARPPVIESPQPSTSAELPLPDVACTPRPDTFDNIRSLRKREDDNAPLGVTHASKDVINVNWVPGWIGRCSVEILQEPRLHFENFAYTKEGTHAFGTETPTRGRCKGKAVPSQIVITSEVAEKIKQGEVEHCEDFRRAYALSWEKYLPGLRALAEGYQGVPVWKGSASADDCRKEGQRLLTDSVGVEPGADFENWKAIGGCLKEKTDKRDDQGWHTLTLGVLVYAPDCSVATYTPNPDGLPEVGNHPPEEVVKECGE